jgi:cell division protein FtsB
MSTRLKRPSIWRQVLVGLALVAFQGYLGYSLLSGQFGIESQKEMDLTLGELRARAAALDAEIADYRHRVALFTPQQLDPDIVSERARALLSMSHADDVIIMVDPRTGEPVHSSYDTLVAERLTDVIEEGID